MDPGVGGLFTKQGRSSSRAALGKEPGGIKGGGVFRGASGLRASGRPLQANGSPFGGVIVPPYRLTRRRFDPSSSPSASLAEAVYSPSGLIAVKPSSSTDFSVGFRTPNRQNFLLRMRKARQMRAFLIANSLGRPMFELFGPNVPKSLQQPNSRKLPFSGDLPWRPKNKATAC